jgi:hypothetical protein
MHVVPTLLNPAGQTGGTQESSLHYSPGFHGFLDVPAATERYQ